MTSAITMNMRQRKRASNISCNNTKNSIQRLVTKIKKHPKLNKLTTQTIYIQLGLPKVIKNLSISSENTN